MVMISRYDPYSRYRARSQQRLARILAILMAGLVCGVIGYGIGYQSARMAVQSVETDLSAMTAERDRLQKTVTRLMADTYSANVKYQEMEKHLQDELPSDGPLKDIVGLIRQQLAAGVDADRISDVIRASRPPRNCTDPEVRRFIVHTGKNKTTENILLLAEGAITIRADGEPARTKDNKEETWYDPSRPVALNFKWKDDKGPQELDRKNNLPISQVIVTNGREYRMTFSEGAKSFLKVTFDSCDYP